jgi:hypothetical protein
VQGNSPTPALLLHYCCYTFSHPSLFCQKAVQTWYAQCLELLKGALPGDLNSDVRVNENHLTEAPRIGKIVEAMRTRGINCEHWANLSFLLRHLDDVCAVPMRPSDLDPVLARNLFTTLNKETGAVHKNRIRTVHTFFGSY